MNPAPALEYKGEEYDPILILEWGELYDNKILGKDCIWVSKHQTPLPLYIEWEVIVGYATFSRTDNGVKMFPTFTNERAILKPSHKVKFEVKWRPGIDFTQDDVSADGSTILHGQLRAVSLMPKSIALDSAKLRLRLEPGA